MKKDELFTNFEEYVLNPDDLNVGMFVGKMNFRKKIIENKYIITSILKNNEIIVKVKCFDFIKNKEVTFGGLNIFTFLKANVDNQECFHYKYKYSTRNYFKQLKVGDEVEFIQPIYSTITPHYVFKIIEKSDGNNFVSDRVNLEDKLGGKMYNVPAILLTDTYEEKINNKLNQVPNLLSQIVNEYGLNYSEILGDIMKFDKENIKIKKNSSTKSKTPTKSEFCVNIDYTKDNPNPIDINLKEYAEDNSYSIKSTKFKDSTKKFNICVNIDYMNNTPIELEFNDGNNSYSRKASISASLDEKHKFNEALKTIVQKDEHEKEPYIPVNGKKYWRFSSLDFRHVESRLFYTNDLISQLDFKIGNFFISKEDLIIFGRKERIDMIKEELAKFAFESK